MCLSCKTDIQTLGSLNDPTIVVPEVANQAVNDSISHLLNYSGGIAEKNDTFSVVTIVKSKYVLDFPDLIKYNNVWYMTMRFSDGHVANIFGHVIVSSSNDLKVWKPEQIYMQPGYDLRDPKLFSDGNLRVHFNSTTIYPYGNIRNDFIGEFQNDSVIWGRAIMINKNTYVKSWFWRITFYNNTYYTCGYLGGNPLKLYTSTDGLDYETNFHFSLNDSPSEATLRFGDQYAYVIIRLNGFAVLGRSAINNLRDWELSSLPWQNIGGPNFLIYKNYLLISGRINNKTMLYSYNLQNKEIKEMITLPTISECGYPGLYIEDDMLYLVYYTGASNNEYAINLASINLTKFNL